MKHAPNETKPMKLWWIAMALASLVGCGGATGDDVYVEPTGAQQQGDTCTVIPGEDMCARFAGAPPATKSTLASVSAFAGDARALVVALETACRDILADLGRPVPTPATNAEPRDRTKLLCAAAASALGELHPQGASVGYDTPTCRASVSPVCVIDAKPNDWQTCDLPKITVKVADGAATPSPAYVTAVETRTPPIFATKALLERMSKRTTEFSGNVSAITDLEAKCIPPLVSMVNGAVADVTACVSISADLIAAL